MFNTESVGTVPTVSLQGSMPKGRRCLFALPWLVGRWWETRHLAPDSKKNVNLFFGPWNNLCGTTVKVFTCSLFFLFYFSFPPPSPPRSLIQGLFTVSWLKELSINKYSFISIIEFCENILILKVWIFWLFLWDTFADWKEWHWFL